MVPPSWTSGLLEGDDGLLRDDLSAGEWPRVVGERGGGLTRRESLILTVRRAVEGAVQVWRVLGVL